MVTDTASSIETRSFQQIWLDLSSNERGNLATDLFKAKACKTYATVHNWGKGRCAPSQPAVRDIVTKVVSRFLSRKCIEATLFPENTATRVS